MEEKSPSIYEGLRSKINRYESIVEISTWLVIIIIIFGIRFLPNRQVDDTKSYILIGAIISFALIYYLIIYKYFPRPNRLYLKDISDILLIGILIHLLKDWGQYFYALFFLPIAAAALSLEFINALLIAVIASLFVVFEIFLGAQGLYPQSGEIAQGAWQVGLILLITIFCRVLAMQVRQERIAKEESLAHQKVLKEEAQRQKEFLSLTSHQLFTPLSMIRGFASMLSQGTFGRLTPKQRDAAEEIYSSSKRMVNLVSELLSISRIQSGQIPLDLKEHRLEDLVKEIVSQFQKTMLKKDLRLEFIPPAPLKPVLMDKEKIRQVIYNLLDNAVKYTRRGKINIALKQSPEWITLAVVDPGVGIAEKDFDKLFQPFFRGKDILELDNKGTGLGLYIARLLVEKHRGKIWAESAGPNRGATFNFRLPLIQSKGKETT
ncbi:MAG TPA: HAMP domain-containing sensor histidine kinase [Patescibacteria group bacterium]|nr:HAMP domain-containing sensor histidine kinase [Patescibacteria group bacterium]